MKQSYKDLLVWQKAIGLVTQIYTVTRTFPKEEMVGLTSQLRRAAVSVPSNIAEGQGRLTPGQFRQFLGCAKGSLAEMETPSLSSRKSLAISNIRNNCSNTLPKYPACSAVFSRH